MKPDPFDDRDEMAIYIRAQQAAEFRKKLSERMRAPRFSWPRRDSGLVVFHSLRMRRLHVPISLSCLTLMSRCCGTIIPRCMSGV